MISEGVTTCKGSLTLNEFGVFGETSDILITCHGCKMYRSMADAFIQFCEAALQQWLGTDVAMQRDREFMRAHIPWCRARHIDPEKLHYPGLRYVLLYSFSHALMRQFALECGYTAASLGERVYSLAAHDDGGSMAGVLLYTSASDSEGTLGGLVRLGTPAELSIHIDNALMQLQWCASDPLCAEHSPEGEQPTLHAAACHACLFTPETSCEHGNRYLDRSLLVATMTKETLAFFPPPITRPSSDINISSQS